MPAPIRPVRLRHALIAAATTLAPALAGAQVARPVAATAASPSVLAPAVPSAGSYRFQLRESDGDASTGTVEWNGPWVRIESSGDIGIRLGGESSGRRSVRDRTHDAARDTERRPARARTRDGGRSSWMLLDQRSGALYIVNDEERRIDVLPSGDFVHVLGTVMGYVAPVVQIRVADAGIRAAAMGDGGLVAGIPTKRFRIVERYTQKVRAMGFEAAASTMIVTTDLRVPVEHGVRANPLADMMLGAASTGTLFDATHRDNLARARAALFRGAPLQVDVTSEETDEDGTERETTSMQVTEVRTDVPDAARFALPTGYERKTVTLPGRRI